MSTPSDIQSSFLSSDNDINDKIEIPFDIVPGKRKNSLLLWSPSENQFYKRNCETKCGTAYLCIDPSCKIRVYLDGNQCFARASADHNHDIKNEDALRYSVMNEIKRKVLENMKMSLREVYNDVISRLVFS